MFPMTSRGRCLPTQAQPPLPGRCTRALCCARLTAAGLRPLQKSASPLLSGVHASAHMAPWGCASPAVASLTAHHLWALTSCDHHMVCQNTAWASQSECRCN